jgi:transcriptional regulator with XRE-family HTH domain
MTLPIGRPRGLTPDGPEIRRLRVDRGVTVTEMAIRIGMHPKSLSRIECQGRRISDVYASRLAKALSIPGERVTVDDITVSDGIGSGAETKIPA